MHKDIEPDRAHRAGAGMAFWTYECLMTPGRVEVSDWIPQVKSPQKVSAAWPDEMEAAQRAKVKLVILDFHGFL